MFIALVIAAIMLYICFTLKANAQTCNIINHSFMDNINHDRQLENQTKPNDFSATEIL